MQYIPPAYCNYGHPIAFNAPYLCNSFPDIIGEGNVTSFMSPDGNMQLVFIPTSQWLRPVPLNINIGNTTNWNPTGAWFVRSISTALQPSPYQYQQQYPDTVAPTNYERSPVPPSYELKFHNDISTSTSDIHYFYPNLRACDWIRPQIRPLVDLVPPRSVYINEVTSVNPNKYTPMDATDNPTEQGNTSIIYSGNSPTKCDTQTSASSLSDMQCECEKKKNAYKRNKIQKRKKKRKSNVCPCIGKTKRDDVCECTEHNATDKGVATYTDQASSCVATGGRETQTIQSDVCDTQTSSKNVTNKKTKYSKKKPDIKTPNTPKCKKYVQIKSSGMLSISRTSKSGSSSTSACTCKSPCCN